MVLSGMGEIEAPGGESYPRERVRSLPQNPDSIRLDPGRLAAVRELNLLDSPTEESFDRLTRLAANLLGVPVAFLSLVDEDRDFYKSCFGFAEPLASDRQMEGRTFCHYALASDGPLVIDDALEEPFFCDVPTVETLGVRAYAGIPLRTEEGFAVGSLCAIDFQPRKWSRLEIETLRELAESALREIRLRQAAAAAEEKTRVAQTAARDREELLAIVAHDLRTPLNFLKLGTEMIAGNSDARENEETLERMQVALNSMSKLIDDLLEVSRIEKGVMTLNLAALNPATLVSDVIAMLRPMAERNQNQLVAEVEAELPEVKADYERILRVFSNLVVNALKFGQQGSSIHLGAQALPDSVRFSVIDQGPGIPSEHLELLFDRYWQANPGDRRGVGLGLGIARSIVQAHGSQLEVSSVVGQGSNFYFDLPLA